MRGVFSICTSIRAGFRFGTNGKSTYELLHDSTSIPRFAATPQDTVSIIFTQKDMVIFPVVFTALPTIYVANDLASRTFIHLYLRALHLRHTDNLEEYTGSLDVPHVSVPN